jgi:CBS domain-containing protein
MSSQVSDVLRGKQSKAVFSISPDEDALKAVRMMAQLNIGALLVMERGRLVGILSERDSVRFVANEGNLDGALVGDLMSAPVRFVRPGSSVDTCMAMMTEGRIRHLPVLGESGQVLGVVSIGDLVKDTISEQAYVIERLEHYITGAPS